MSFMFEVLYKPPSDPRREALISERVSKYGGRLTYREEPIAPGIGPVCLTFEFGELQVAQEAATSLRLQGEHVEGPVDYGNRGPLVLVEMSDRSLNLLKGYNQTWRDFIVGPVVFALSGAGVGICWAMLYRQEPQERAHVYLDESMPPAFLGFFIGHLVGWAMWLLCRSRPGLRPLFLALGAMALCAGAAAPFGWIVGEIASRQREPVAGMTWGGISGAAVGLLIGLVQWRCDCWVERHSIADSSTQECLE